jgi:serine/threonine protein kinase
LGSFAQVAGMDFNIPGYTLKKPIASGGMATVYLADRTKDGRTHETAVKIFKPESMECPLAKRFVQEARILAGLQHINVIKIYDVGMLDTEELFLAMDYLPGGDLSTYQYPGKSEDMAFKMLTELACALQYIHNNDIIHCDIKPANILFRKDGSLVLTDFGIAKNLQSEQSREKAKTTEASPDYCSPEQAQGHPLDARTDIYSLGVVFLERLLGYNPYRGETMRDSMINHVKMDIPTLTGEHKDIQPLINMLLAKDPDDRFSSLNECMDYIDMVLPVSLPKITPNLGDDKPSLLDGLTPESMTGIS